MKIPYIKIPIADLSAYLSQVSCEAKGKIFQAILDFGLYQQWNDLQLSDREKIAYSNVQEIVENEIKSYKKFCKEQKQKIKKTIQKKETVPSFSDLMFEKFWEVFPKMRIGNKAKAKSAFISAVKRSGLTPDQIVTKAEEYAKSDEVARGFAKGAQAWLNDDRFFRKYNPSFQNGSSLEEARAEGMRIIEDMFGGQK